MLRRSPWISGSNLRLAASEKCHLHRKTLFVTQHTSNGLFWMLFSKRTYRMTSSETIASASL